MLRVLHIKNFSIIDDANIEFGEGFNVLTGETGAGKSIIIDALCLALGERAASEVVRSGEKEAVVAAFFDISPDRMDPASTRFLEDFGISIDNGLILKRIVSAQGKSRAFVNGSMVNVQTLSDISKNIIDVHGQYEHQSLLSPDNQIDMLDAYGGLLYERQEVKTAYESLCALRRQIADLLQKEKERAQRLDLLAYQINEIEAANPDPGEEEGLAEEIRILGNAGRLAELANNAYEALYSSDSACITELSRILNSLREISGIDPRADEAVKSAQEALPLLEETGYFLRDYRDSLNHDPQRLEQALERLELIKGLGRKYGSGVQEILDYRDKAVAEHEELKHSEEKLGSLKKDLEALTRDLTEKTRELSKKRKAASKIIEAEVVSRLSALSMAGTRFSILIKQEKGDDTVDGFRATQKGIDSVEFLISPNVGEDLKPLARTASGGELSRVMLALKSVMAKGDNIPVLVFDEIDAGIGGRTAETVGRKLKNLSINHQVICVTHLPQIASYADRHLRIEKKVKKERTIVEINSIEKDERAAEIARMLGGELSAASLTHAKEMLGKRRKS
ncbi:MAG: DNA repair protein RecN [Nitrospiraceae bacterium]|nr:MAG: DNA repair protein RecN [Nitrospiraceae bacterium]